MTRKTTKIKPLFLFMKRFLLHSLFILLFSAFYWNASDIGDAESYSFRKVKSPLPYMSVESAWADSLILELSLEEKIAQLCFIRANSEGTDWEDKRLLEAIENYGVGGLAFFKGSPNAQFDLTKKAQNNSKLPLLISIDGEWGLSMRLDSTLKYPWMMTLGAIQNNDLIYDMAWQMADEFNRLGVHINLAPVADVNNNAENPIINSRSFGEDIYNVLEKTTAYTLGLQDNGVMACAKHFPGHGDTDMDSHKQLPLIPFDRNRLDSLELFPFRGLIDEGVGSIMIAHLNIPALTGDSITPSSVSKKVVNDLLKQELNYEGLIMTDGLAMKGVSDHYAHGRLEIESLKAGNDVLLLPEDMKAVIDSVVWAVSTGELSMDRIDESCHKVLRIKEWLGLHENSIPDSLDHAESFVNRPAEILKKKLMQAALTVVKNEDGLLPIKLIDERRIALVSLGGTPGNTFYDNLNLHLQVDRYIISEKHSQEGIDKILAKISEEYNTVMVSIHKSDKNPWKSYKISDRNKVVLSRLAHYPQSVLVHFANPYALKDLEDLSEFNAIVAAYQNNKEAEQAAAELMIGALGADGKLPVTIQDVFPVGTGVAVKKLPVLSNIYPEELGIQSQDLAIIDSIAIDAIQMKATPGCQILIAKEGKVFYNKAFGYHTYDSLKKVDILDLYDIASITKIAATVPSIMKLVSDNEISLDSALNTYLNMADTCNKKDLTIRDILAHQAKLKPWIPFYKSTLKEDKKLNEDIYHSMSSDSFQVQVADDLFIRSDYQDSITIKILDSDLLEKKGYKYSDLGYYLLKEIIETKTGQDLDEYVADEFYNKLGAYHMTYTPLSQFDLEEIVPTEEDDYFRFQKVHGHVHDMGAAMQGGIGGHAGVFSNAFDLAKLMQMYLQGGVYGDEDFIKSSVLEEFTRCQFCEDDNRRGIGFDKPVRDGSPGPTCDCVSYASYGHTGFTGTMAWVDPETELIYIFLSNRVYPDMDNTKLIKENIRTKIQEEVYNILNNRKL